MRIISAASPSHSTSSIRTSDDVSWFLSTASFRRSICTLASPLQLFLLLHLPACYVNSLSHIHTQTKALKTTWTCFLTWMKEATQVGFHPVRDMHRMTGPHVGRPPVYLPTNSIPEDTTTWSLLPQRKKEKNKRKKSPSGGIVGLALAKAAALRININLDGAPIASKSHTHPSHSQTSRLLTSSLSLGVPVSRPTQCVRDT